MSAELRDSYDSIYQDALAQMTLGNSEKAIESMLRIVRRLCRLRSETLERKPNLQETLESAWHSAVEFLRWEKRYDEAIAVCEQILDCLPPSGRNDARVRIASLMIEKGDAEEGLSRLRDIAQESQTFGSWAELGAEYVALRRYEEAAKCYESALALAENNDQAALANLGLHQIYKEQGDVDQALDAWSMAVVLGPDLASEADEIYAWLIERGDLDKAQQYLRRERDPLRLGFYQGLLDWKAGREQEARSKWRQIVDTEVDPQGTDVEVWMEAALRLEEPAKVIEVVEEVLSPQHAMSLKTMILIAIAYVLLDEIDQAKRWLELAVTRLRRSWPSRDKIPADDWAFLTSLSPSQESLRQVASFFETGKQGA
jgi:tetratricopeptide (TPR) repeat protein